MFYPHVVSSQLVSAPITSPSTPDLSLALASATAEADKYKQRAAKFSAKFTEMRAETKKYQEQCTKVRTRAHQDMLMYGCACLPWRRCVHAYVCALPRDVMYGLTSCLPHIHPLSFKINSISPRVMWKSTRHGVHSCNRKWMNNATRS